MSLSSIFHEEFPHFPLSPYWQLPQHPLCGPLCFFLLPFSKLSAMCVRLLLLQHSTFGSAVCSSNLLLCNKVPQNSMAENNTVGRASWQQLVSVPCSISCSGPTRSGGCWQVGSGCWFLSTWTSPQGGFASSHVVIGFKKWMSQETGSGNCKLLKPWTQKLVQCHFYHRLLTKYHRDRWKGYQRIWGPCFKTATFF